MNPQAKCERRVVAAVAESPMLNGRFDPVGVGSVLAD
jgi:hypothetical protein